MAGPWGVIRLDGGMPGLCSEWKKTLILLSVVSTDEETVGREDRILC